MADLQASQVTNYQTSLPDYAKPFVEDMLGQAQGLTDMSSNPYMQYMGERVAQFTPMQQQAFEGAQGMQTAPQLKQATDLTGLASQAALNYGNGSV